VKEVDRLAGRLRRAKQLRIPLWYDIQLGIIITPLAGFALCVMGGLAGAEGAFLLTALYLVFFPSLWFARIKKRYPRDLAEKLHAFTPVLNNPAETPEKKDSPWNGYKVTPMILFDRDNEGGKTPRDIRVMLEPPKNKTPELAGVQFQITFNRGPRGKVPYMYAVFITRGKGQLWQRLGDLEYPGYTVEKESSPEQEEYGAVVLRLHTTSRRDGYHTREEDIKTLISRVKETLEKIETPWGSKRSL
jgi:hypothetical protein